MALNHVVNSNKKAESDNQPGVFDDFVNDVIIKSGETDMTSGQLQQKNTCESEIVKTDETTSVDDSHDKDFDGVADTPSDGHDSKEDDSKKTKQKTSRRLRDKKKGAVENFITSDKEKASCKLKCKECGKTLSSQRCLNAHMRRIHIKNDKTASRKINNQANRNTYTCPCCNVKVHTQPSLADHMTSAHGGEHHFKCNQCDKKFLTPRRMNDHARKVHITCRKHACDLCGKAFKDVHALNRHTNCYHNNERRFSCTVCNTQFKMKYSLVAHLKNVHGDGEDQHECDICKKRFMSQINVERHKQCVHFAKIIGKCEFCDKSFTKEANLLTHIQTVHGTDQNFVCELCGAVFKKKHLVTEHVKCVHLNERNFPCPYEVCDKTFKTTAHVRTHVKNIHERQNGDIVQPMEIFRGGEETDSCEMGSVISITDHRSVHILPNEHSKHTVTTTENKKPVILSTNENVSNVTSVDALRVVQSFQSFIYDRENEPTTQYLVIAADSTTDDETKQNGNEDNAINAVMITNDNKPTSVGNIQANSNGNVMVTTMVHSDT